MNADLNPDFVYESDGEVDKNAKVKMTFCHKKIPIKEATVDGIAIACVPCKQMLDKERVS